MKRLISTIDWINEGVGRAVAWLTTILVILVCFDVVVRYCFNETQAWIMELEWHLFALIFLLGAGYAFKHDRHVRVDVFYDRFSEREKAWVQLIGGLVFLLPWTILLLYATSGFAMTAYLDNEGSPDPGGLPARYLIKGAVPIGVFLLLLQGVASILRAIQSLTAKPEP